VKTKAQFRWLLVAYLLVTACNVASSCFFWYRLVPERYQDLARECWELRESVPWSYPLWYSLLGLMAIGLVGMFLFWRPARWIFFASLVAGFATYFPPDAGLATDIGLLVDSLDTLLAGIVVALAFFAPVRRFFYPPGALEASGAGGEAQPPAGPPPKPRAWSTISFFAGLGAGVVALMLVGVVFGLVMSRMYMPDFDDMESFLDEPEFPTGAVAEAEYDWSVQSLDGEVVDMSATEGSVVFLNFWATWCPPCVGEMPSVQRLHDEVAREGVLFFCISDEPADMVRAFVEESGWEVPIYTVEGGPPAVYETDAIPATFILGPGGEIAFAHTGAALWDSEGTVEFLRGLLEGGAGAEQ